MPRKITPVEDWKLDCFIGFDPALDYQIDGTLWVGGANDPADAMVNLDISYSHHSDNRFIDLYLSPDDAERIGIMLQYAAKRAREDKAELAGDSNE